MNTRTEERIRDELGRFSDGDKPPSKPVLVYLPQPIVSRKYFFEKMLVRKLKLRKS